MEIDPLSIKKKNVVPDFAPLPSVDSVLQSATTPTPSSKLDAVLATKPPARQSIDDYYQGQLAAHNALIQQLANGFPSAQPTGTPLQPATVDGTTENPYGGSVPTGTNVYNGQDGNAAYADVNRTAFDVYRDGSTRARSVDARAPLSATEVTNRNNNDQFFESRRMARAGAPITTREDMRWRSIFPNGSPTVPAGVTSSTGGQNNAGSATRAIVKPVNIGAYQEPGSVARTTFSNAPDRMPYIGGANGDMTQDFIAGGRYSSAKFDSDRTLEPSVNDIVTAPTTAFNTPGRYAGNELDTRVAGPEAWKNSMFQDGLRLGHGGGVLPGAQGTVYLPSQPMYQRLPFGQSDAFPRFPR